MFALAVRQAWIAPQRLEIRCHGDQPLPDRVVESKPVIPPTSLSFLLRRGQRAQRGVPLAFERIRDETIVRIDQHESPLREIGIDLGALHRAKAEPIGVVVAGFDLASNLQGQIDRGGRHLGGDQRPDRLIDGRSRNRLAVRLAARAVGAVADVPCLQASAPRRIAGVNTNPG